MSTSIAYSNVFLNLKKKQKNRKTHGKSKSKTSKPKKTGNKINGKKRNVKKGKTWEKNGLVHLHFCCFFFSFSICFFLLLFFFFAFAWKKGKKSKIKAKQKQKKANRKSTKKQQKCNGQVHVFPIFPFLFFLFVSFFPFYLLLCFLDLLILLFGFSICFAFFAFFSSFKKIRISYGLVNIIIRCHKHIPWRTIIWLNYPQEPKVYRDRSRPKSLDNSWIQVTRVWMSLPQQVLRFRWLSLEFEAEAWQDCFGTAKHAIHGTMMKDDESTWSENEGSCEITVKFGWCSCCDMGSTASVAARWQLLQDSLYFIAQPPGGVCLVLDWDTWQRSRWRQSGTCDKSDSMQSPPVFFAVCFHGVSIPCITYSFCGKSMLKLSET